MLLLSCRLMMMMMDGQRQPWTDDGGTDGAGHNAQKLGQWRGWSKGSFAVVTSPCFFCLREREKLFEGDRDLVRASPAFYGTLVMSARGRSKEPDGAGRCVEGLAMASVLPGRANDTLPLLAPSPQSPSPTQHVHGGGEHEIHHHDRSR